MAAQVAQLRVAGAGAGAGKIRREVTSGGQDPQPAPPRAGPVEAGDVLMVTRLHPRRTLIGFEPSL